ncbi:hypothetical protein, partial [Actinoplanes nipponensis]|uniref:hypothetical protein n=1 Tax=Actinoplanes nipponensis TaxID=135950 RepID=UPI0031F0E4D2
LGAGNGTLPVHGRAARGGLYERVFLRPPPSPTGLSIQNFYMTFGAGAHQAGAWLPAPVVYSSYDYGAAISEARQLRPRRWP